MTEQQSEPLTISLLPRLRGSLKIGLGDPQDALHAIVDVGETPGLLAVAPHLDVLCACQHLDSKQQGYGLGLGFRTLGSGLRA